MFDLPWRIMVNSDGTLKHKIAHYRAPDEIEGSVVRATPIIPFLRGEHGSSLESQLCLSACQDDQQAYQIRTTPETTHGALSSCMDWLLGESLIVKAF